MSRFSATAERRSLLPDEGNELERETRADGDELDAEGDAEDSSDHGGDGRSEVLQPRGQFRGVVVVRCGYSCLLSRRSAVPYVRPKVSCPALPTVEQCQGQSYHAKCPARQERVDELGNGALRVSRNVNHDDRRPSIRSPLMAPVKTRPTVSQPMISVSISGTAVLA